MDFRFTDRMMNSAVSCLLPIWTSATAVLIGTGITGLSSFNTPCSGLPRNQVRLQGLGLWDCLHTIETVRMKEIFILYILFDCGKKKHCLKRQKCFENFF